MNLSPHGRNPKLSGSESYLTKGVEQRRAARRRDAVASTMRGVIEDAVHLNDGSQDQAKDDPAAVKLENASRVGFLKSRTHSGEATLKEGINPLQSVESMDLKSTEQSTNLLAVPHVTHRHLTAQPGEGGGTIYELTEHTTLHEQTVFSGPPKPYMKLGPLGLEQPDSVGKTRLITDSNGLIVEMVELDAPGGPVSTEFSPMANQEKEGPSPRTVLANAFHGATFGLFAKESTSPA